jgi:hypothetical protein
MEMVDRPGDFRGVVEEYGVRKTDKSKSVGVNILMRITEMYDHDAQEWVGWDYQHHVYGTIWVIKKDGTPNDNGVKSAVEALDWDGSFTSLSAKTWKPAPCSFSVVEKEYQGSTSLEISFFNEYDRVPGGGMKQLDENEVKAIQAQYGSPLRGLAAQFKRNKTVPAAGSKPAAPPPAKRQPEPVTNGAPQEDVPF